MSALVLARRVVGLGKSSGLVETSGLVLARLVTTSDQILKYLGNMTDDV